MNKVDLMKVLDHIISEDRDQASKLLHDWFVDMSKGIHESMMQEDDEVLDDERLQDIQDDKAEIESEEFFGEGELEDEESEEGDAEGSEEGSEEGDEGEAAEGDLDDRVEDLESTLAQLKAQFAELMGGEEAKTETVDEAAGSQVALSVDLYGEGKKEIMSFEDPKDAEVVKLLAQAVGGEASSYTGPHAGKFVLPAGYLDSYHGYDAEQVAAEAEEIENAYGDAIAANDDMSDDMGRVYDESVNESEGDAGAEELKSNPKGSFAAGNILAELTAANDYGYGASSTHDLGEENGVSEAVVAYLEGVLADSDYNISTAFKAINAAGGALDVAQFKAGVNKENAKARRARYDEEVDESIDFLALDESFELEKVNHSGNAEDREIGDNGGKVASNKRSPLPQNKKGADRVGGKPVEIKAEEHKGYDRESAPEVKKQPLLKNQVNNAKSDLKPVSKEGDKSALLNSKEGFGSDSPKSPIGAGATDLRGNDLKRK